MKEMKDVTPEFSRPLEVARVPNLGSHEKISADARECATLAKRFRIPAVHAVSAQFLVKPWRGGGFKVSGTVVADIDQESVVSLEVFRSEARFEVLRYFLPRLNPEEDSEEDIDQIINGAIDLGEIAAETIGLELDPYPRKPGEEFASGPEPEDDPPSNVSPFAALKKAKD